MVLDLRNFDERENPRSIERNALPCWGEGSANGANSAFLPVDQRVPDRFSPYQTQSSGIGFEKTTFIIVVRCFDPIQQIALI
jgi:hypothetical protein